MREGKAPPPHSSAYCPHFSKRWRGAPSVRPVAARYTHEERTHSRTTPDVTRVHHRACGFSACPCCRGVIAGFIAASSGDGDATTVVGIFNLTEMYLGISLFLTSPSPRFLKSVTETSYSSLAVTVHQQKRNFMMRRCHAVAPSPQIESRSA